MLIDPNVQRDVSFFTIVGIGGLGKTTLAQLVYNDERIRNEFPLRVWACVSDDDKKPLNIKVILCKILESATGKKHDGFELEYVQNELRQSLEGKKYFLVLDDVWSENPVELRKLTEFLMGGKRGSWIVVTTRSKETGRVIGDGCAFELEGLSQENSWRLFEMVAFGELQEQPKPELVEIGKKIVRSCVGVPLAIRVIGSLLYGQGKTMWESFKDNGIANIRRGNNNIMPILKFSYYHLDPLLKSCFKFCALFPKDFVMEKQMLIDLWMAHGCIVPFDKGQSVEDAGEEYFSILLRRCFFQDVERDIFGEIAACKVHDLMHDIAQEVAGKEIYVADSITCQLDKRVHHIFLTEGKCAESFITKTKLRTYLHDTWCMQTIPLDTLLENWTCLRVLDLHSSAIGSLPEKIGKLLHLRYLDLSHNKDLVVLPQSITKLHNLQTLRIRGCYELRELPTDLSKLVKLRVLDIEDCHGLTCMPSGMNMLTCLHNLTRFVVSQMNSLEDLKALIHLKGRLTIILCTNAGTSTYDTKKVRKGGYLRTTEHLNQINLHFDRSDIRGDSDCMEAFLEGLEPHPNLQGFYLEGYNGVRIPSSWAREDETFLLVNLVSIKLNSCKRLQFLPSLCKLPHLKRLSLENLRSIDWIENGNCSCTTDTTFFPSLEELELGEISNLKGWWREEMKGDDDHSTLFFPCLSKLAILNCPHLTSLPLCPNVERFQLLGCNKALQPIIMNTICGNKLRWVFTDDMGYLNSLPMEAFRHLAEMHIWWDEEIESLSEVAEVFRSCSSSLRSLTFQYCYQLKGVCGGLEHLTALESLSIIGAENLDLVEEEEEDGMPWRSLQHSLWSLKLEKLPKLMKLPNGMQHLTSLRSLEISRCENLVGLPEWVCSSSSLVLDIK